MRKKIVALFTTIIAVIMLSGCNYQPLDTNMTYNYAIIQLQNGEIIEGEVTKWKDYDGEQLQVEIDGVIYLTSSYNCTLIRK